MIFTSNTCVSRWIGLSILSVVELSELVYRLAYKRIALWMSQRKVRNTLTTMEVSHR